MTQATLSCLYPNRSTDIADWLSNSTAEFSPGVHRLCISCVGCAQPLSRVPLFATPWTVAHQARILEYWSWVANTGVGCHFLLQGSNLHLLRLLHGTQILPRAGVIHPTRGIGDRDSSLPSWQQRCLAGLANQVLYFKPAYSMQ